VVDRLVGCLVDLQGLTPVLSFACNTPNGQTVRLDDLPIEDIQGIADSCGLESWVDRYLQPARFGKATIALYRHCCKVADCDPAEPVTPKIILGAFEPVEEDTLPTLWEDGNPPTADAPTTD
jgi:hypothetical protein